MKLGGNCKCIRPSVDPKEIASFEEALNLLKPGDVARFEAVFHEVFWELNPEKGNYAGIGKAIELAAAKGLVPMILLNPSVYPGSPANPKSYNNWWMHHETLLPQVLLCLEKLCDFIKKKLAECKVKNYYIQMYNEPSKGKPGGSISADIIEGEWHPLHHKYFFAYAKSIRKYFTRSVFVGPAISCFKEGNAFGYEMMSCIPPKEYNWLSLVGIRSYHIRMGASWAGNVAQYEGGVAEIIKQWKRMDRFVGSHAFSTQKVCFTEVYVAIADCGGKNLAFDTTPFKTACLKKMTENLNLEFATMWGLKDRDFDAEGNLWFEYGGWGKALKAFAAAPAVETKV
jgi:hypothetical protein